jgi:PAS domain S-box-containing protein
MSNAQKGIKIRFFYKLLTGFGTLCLIIGITLTFGNRTIKDTSDMLHTVVSKQVRSLAQISQLHYHANQIRLLEVELSEITDYYTISGGIDNLYALAESFDKDLRNFVLSFIPEEDETARSLLGSWELYRKDLEQSLQYIKSMDVTEAKKISRYSSFPRFQVFSKYLEQISTKIEKRAQQDYANSIAELEMKRHIFSLISIMGIIGGIIITFLLSRSLSSRILVLRTEALRLADGNMENPISIEGNDELTDLAASFNVMRVNIQNREDALKSAHDQLEERVKERTAELTIANRHLEKAKGELEKGNEILSKEITVRKKTEDALRKSEEFTKRVIESSNDCIKVLDLEGHLLSMSEGGQKLLEICDLTPYLNMSFVDFWKGKDREGCLEAISKAKQGDTGIFYGYFETVKGKPKWWEVIITPIKDADGSIDRLLAVSRDITERKLAERRQAQLLEQLEKTNQELKDFAYVVSHDLKAPLRGIKTLAEWITTDYADKLDDNGKEQMSLLAGRVDRMHNLIDGILQYSRIGRAEEEKVVVNLNELVTEVIDMITPPENVTITIENELPTIECEQTRIMQVFQNLLSNAVKYMDKPKGQINVGCVEENGFWEFYVADNGPGIEEKHFEKIFQLFQTLAPRDESESTGIGLTIIKKIVEMYGGKTWVQSKVGSGSTFFFTLPKQEMGVKNAKLEASIVG